MSTIVTRAGKGSALTHNEVDANFTNLNTDKIEATQTVTLTNKTLTTPVLSGTASGTTAGRLGYLSGNFSYGNGSVQRTVANTDESQTLTNKTLTNPVINGFTGNTSAITIGTNQIIKDTSGNVGIGITPTQKLHVSGNILATGSVDCGTQFLGLSTDSATAPSFSFTGDTNTGMFSPGADQAAITTNGVARLTVNTTQFTGTLPWRGQNGTAAAPALSASGDTNTGIYFPAANTIGLVTNGSEGARLTSTNDLQFNSGYGSVATAYGCRAWVNFNGTGTVAIRASGNVSSITDNNTGNYTVNFTTAMPDANYAAPSSTGQNGTTAATQQQPSSHTYTTTSVSISSVQGSTRSFSDASEVSVAIFR
jgi:hypothetical protein